MIVACCRHDDTTDREWEHADDQWSLPSTEEVLWSQEPNPRTKGMLLTLVQI